MPATAAMDNETLDHLLSLTNLALAALDRPVFPMFSITGEGNGCRSLPCGDTPGTHFLPASESPGTNITPVKIKFKATSSVPKSARRRLHAALADEGAQPRATGGDTYPPSFREGG